MNINATHLCGLLKTSFIHFPFYEYLCNVCYFSNYKFLISTKYLIMYSNKVNNVFFRRIILLEMYVMFVGITIRFETQNMFMREYVMCGLVSYVKFLIQFAHSRKFTNASKILLPGS